MHDEFTARLGHAFEVSGLTQQGLADRLGVSQSIVSHWLTGRRRPTFGRIERIASELSVDAAYLAFGVQPQAPARRPRTVSAKVPATKATEVRAAS